MIRAGYIAWLLSDYAAKCYDVQAHPETARVASRVARMYSALGSGGIVENKRWLKMWAAAQEAWLIARSTDQYKAGYVARAAIHASRAPHSAEWQSSDLGYVLMYLAYAAGQSPASLTP